MAHKQKKEKPKFVKREQLWQDGAKRRRLSPKPKEKYKNWQDEELA